MQGGHEYDWKEPRSYLGRNLPDTINGSHQMLRGDRLVEPEACQQDSPQFINVVVLSAWTERQREVIFRRFSEKSKFLSPWVSRLKRTSMCFWALNMYIRTGKTRYLDRKFKWKSENQSRGRSGYYVELCDLWGKGVGEGGINWLWWKSLRLCPQHGHTWSVEIFQTSPACEPGVAILLLTLTLWMASDEELSSGGKRGLGAKCKVKAWLLGVRNKDQQRGHRL